MSGKLYDILMCCKIDLKYLVQVKTYLKNSAKRKTTTILTVETIKAISTIVSTIYSLHHPESEYMEIIIDTLLFAVANEKNEFRRMESELENLTLKILESIEHNAKFHILFCKLLSFINLMCSHSINVWQPLARLVLNIFIYKKFEHVYMEKALREFINISKNSKLSELVRVIRQNQDISRGFSMLARGYGDFLVQMNILELLVLLRGYDKSIVKTVFGHGNQETSELLDYLTFSDFRKDSRIFLNAFNKSLGLGKKVFSLKCSAFYFVNSKLSPPPGTDGIWTDLNQDSKSISIFCTRFLLNQSSTGSDILQLPAKEVERIKLKICTISGEDWYCIFMRIKNTSEIDNVKAGSGVICKALVSINQRKEVVDFVKAIEELSEKIQWCRKVKTNEIPNSGDSLSLNSRTGHLKSPPGESKNQSDKILVRSPLISGSKDKNDNKQSLSLSQTSYTSSVFSIEKELSSEEKSSANLNMKVWRNRFQEKTNNLKEVLGDLNLQVNQISSSVLESQILTLDSSFNSSLPSHISAEKEILCSEKGVSNNTQLDINRTKVGITNKLLLNIQHGSGPSNYKNMIGSNSNDTKNNEGLNQIKRNYSRRMYEEWTNSLDDFTCADELPLRESNKENLSGTLNISVLPGKKSDNKTRKPNLTQQNKKLKLKEEKKEEIYKTSLLDPNGYSYKRWQSQTTSKRSNFWLDKLKETKTKTSRPMRDIFNFSEHEDDSDESNVFKKKTSTVKKTGINKDKANNGIQKFSFHKKGDKALKNNNGKAPIKEFIFQPKVIVNPESQPRVRRTGKSKELFVRSSGGTSEISVKDGTVPENQDYHFEEYHNNLPLKAYSSRHDDRKQKSDVKHKNDDRKRTEENNSRKNQSSGAESFLSSINKRKESREVREESNSTMLGEKFRQIETEIWKSMSQFLEETRKREEKEFTTYMNTLEDIMNCLAEEKEEVENRLTRFDKCVQFFRLGASLLEISEESQKHLENQLEDLKNTFRIGKSKKSEMRMNEFLQNVEVKLLEKVKKIDDKGLRDCKINALERYLSACDA